jgi:septum formation protein
MSAEFVYLASASPRRRELLKQIGVPFQLLEVEVDESVAAREAPATYVARVACAKARAGWERRRAAARTVAPAAPVLAADTTVVLDGRILGQPQDGLDAVQMLLALGGRTHEVLTAIALATADGVQSRLSRSEVTFRQISAAQAQRYWDTGEPRGKAGGYAIQGRAAVFVADLRGSYSGVMGLPLYETAELLDLAGVPHWQ